MVQSGTKSVLLARKIVSGGKGMAMQRLKERVEVGEAEVMPNGP